MKNGTIAPDVPFSIIFSKLLKCKKYFFWKIFENLNYLKKLMQCSKYSIWGICVKRLAIIWLENNLTGVLCVYNNCLYFRGFILSVIKGNYIPRKLCLWWKVCGGYTVFTLSVRPFVCPSACNVLFP